MICCRRLFEFGWEEAGVVGIVADAFARTGVLTAFATFDGILAEAQRDEVSVVE